MRNFGFCTESSHFVGERGRARILEAARVGGRLRRSSREWKLKHDAAFAMQMRHRASPFLRSSTRPFDSETSYVLSTDGCIVRRCDWGVTVGGSGELCRLTDRELAEIFHQRGRDPEFLESLSVELKARDSDEALDLHFKVVTARRALRLLPTTAGSRPEASQLTQLQSWLRTFFSGRDLARADGRPLYRYRMTDSEYEEARKILRHLASAGRFMQPDDHAGALFVAYCAEWFRRESASTFLR